MNPKSAMLSAIVSTWMFAATSCTALPFVYAVPSLRGGTGNIIPLLAAMVIGAAVSVPLSLVVRRLCDLAAPTKSTWGSFGQREAAFFGIIAWGLPLGLMFAVNEFLASSRFSVLAPAFIIWPLAGIAFGLVMRWLARRGDRDSKAA